MQHWWAEDILTNPNILMFINNIKIWVQSLIENIIMNFSIT